MSDSNLTILFIGDVVGKPGRKAVVELLDGLVDRHNVDLVVANGENVAGGFGLTADSTAELFDAGVHLLTTGNHVWDKKEALELLDETEDILRPANYPEAPGAGYRVIKTPGGTKVAVINLEGRVFMSDILCPFRTADSILGELPDDISCIVVDLHAEATSEKRAMGIYLDGRVSALVGTHTHVQTADERVLPGGTAYITDLGMTGNEEGSVIGIDSKAALYRFRTQMPARFDLAKGEPVLNGAVINLDPDSGKAVDIQRVSIPLGRRVAP
jgi:metallophosphoesterase (TIGR00282 family)